MWAIFLLSALSFAVVTLIVIYIGNKVIMAIENDRKNNNKKSKNKKGKKKGKKKE